MDVYAQLAQAIIEQQETIIGPVAVEQAEQLSEFRIDWPKHEVTISGDGRSAINKLVAQYRHLFGQVSVEVCKEAVAKIIPQLPPGQLPESLR